MASNKKRERLRRLMAKHPRRHPIEWDIASAPNGGPVILLRPCQCHWFLAMVGKRRGEAGYYSGWIYGESANPGNTAPVPGSIDEETVHLTIDAAIEAARHAAQAAQGLVLDTMMAEGGARH
jgi:hypothetical protein